MNNTQIEKLIEEIRTEQHVSPNEEDEVIEKLIKEAEFDINSKSGAKIDYDADLTARGLLKNYVMYRRFGRIAEFKQLYAGDYADLQAKYYNPSDI
jgi:hypothetical protein